MERSPAMDSNPKENLDAIRSKTPSTLRRVGMYALARILTIGITIVVGIFAAVVVANKGGGIDASVSSSLRDIAQQQAWSLGQSLSFEERQEATSKYYEELLENSGINDPFLKKHIRWTWNALQLELGEAIYTRLRATYVVQQQRDDIKAIVLSHLPNTLALVGLADFFVFAIGIPLSLYLSQNYGNWIDKTINFLSPLSSVPSWVHGVLLILIFAVTLRVLPPGGMIDVPIPDTRLGVLASRLKHMILPSLALFLSLMFQLVYTWRNYFMIYSNEDYVEYAVSKGLSNSTIRNKYILRPTMPYVLTSFALTLVSFWQMATALEVVFDWDGIGSMYILSLPNFFGESMFPGEMGLTIGIVVIFAYILGLVVFLLDISYAVVDPRIRLEGTQQRIKPTRGKRNYNILNWFKSFSSNISKKPRSAESSSGRAEKAIAKKNTRSSKLVLIFFLLLIIGITVGLAFGWWIWPVELINAAPADLHPNYQADYIRLVIDAFNSNQDSALAQRRLDALGDQAAPALNNFLESIDSDAAALESISRFAANFKLAENSLPQASTDVVPQENGRLDRKLITLVVLFAGLAAIAIGSFYLYQRRYQHPENSKLAKKHKKTSGKSGSGTPQPEPTLPSSRKRLKNVFREMIRYPSAVVGMVILLVMVLGSLYAVVRYPYREIATNWFEDIRVNPNVPRTAYPQWVNFFLKDDFPETIINNSAEMPETKSVKILENGNPDYTFTF
ncbi:MAG: ABC transporter permease, partial [Anaerolineales bacterium]